MYYSMLYFSGLLRHFVPRHDECAKIT